MYYGTIKKYDIANGPGVRVSLVCVGLPPSLQGLFQCGDVGFPIWTVIYRRDGERDFSGIGAGIYTGLYAARRRTV